MAVALSSIPGKTCNKNINGGGLLSAVMTALKMQSQKKMQAISHSNTENPVPGGDIPKLHG